MGFTKKIIGKNQIQEIENNINQIKKELKSIRQKWWRYTDQFRIYFSRWEGSGIPE